MIAKALEWLVLDLKQHRNPYVWIVLTALFGMFHTYNYATPAYVTAGINERLGNIEYESQLKYVRELRTRLNELEYKDKHNGGNPLPEYLIDELNDTKSILPEEERKLDELLRQQREAGKSTRLNRWNVFSLVQAI